MRAFWVLVLLGGCNLVFELSPPPDADAPPSDAAIACTAKAVAASGGHTCALHTDGHVSCWGHNVEHEAGVREDLCTANNRQFQCVPSPLLVPGVTEATALGLADRTSCAIRTDGVVCWGRNQDGELGNPFGNLANPRPMSDLGVVEALGGGERHVCTLESGGRIRCAGFNSFGEVGNDTQLPVTPPVELTISAEHLASGYQHNCAVVQGGVYCWGRNEHGQVFDMPRYPILAPQPVPGVTGATHVAVGVLHSCALLSDATAMCWGDNDAGQLGVGDQLARTGPTALALGGIDQLTGGVGHACALAGGTVYCWGSELGYPLVPTIVPLAGAATQITSGSYHACALLDDGSVWCWGSNWYGQLGDGTVHYPDFLPPRQAKLCP